MLFSMSFSTALSVFSFFRTVRLMFGCSATFLFFFPIRTESLTTLHGRVCHYKLYHARHILCVRNSTFYFSSFFFLLAFLLSFSIYSSYVPNHIRTVHFSLELSLENVFNWSLPCLFEKRIYSFSLHERWSCAKIMTEQTTGYTRYKRLIFQFYLELNGKSANLSFFVDFQIIFNFAPNPFFTMRFNDVIFQHLAPSLLILILILMDGLVGSLIFHNWILNDDWPLFRYIYWNRIAFQLKYIFFQWILHILRICRNVLQSVFLK